MEAWLANPELLEADKDAEYAAVIEINMDDIRKLVFLKFQKNYSVI